MSYDRSTETDRRTGIPQPVPQAITVFLLEHHRVGRHERLFLRGVEEFVQRPPDVLLVLGQHSFILPTSRSKSSHIHVGHIQTEVASDGLL